MKHSPFFSANFYNSALVNKSILVLGATGLLAFSHFSAAAGECKGLQQASCNSDASCSWINSYTTKKGKTINAYCRNKSKPNKASTVPGGSVSSKTDKKG